MDTLTLGDTGILVSEFALGTGTFGQVDWGATEEESGRILDAYLARGGNFIDTANKYGGGETERILGRLLVDRREELVVGSKYTAAHPGTVQDDPNAFGNHKKNLVTSLDRSLMRLGVEYLDILWVHAWDARTSIAGLMRALDDQVRAGKVLHLGISNTPAWVTARANTLAHQHGWTPFSAVQIEYSLLVRGAEREVVPMARHLGLRVMAWAALGWGVLTGKYFDQESAGPRRLPDDHHKVDDRSRSIVREVQAVAGEIGATAAQVSLAWVRQRPFRPVGLLGARTKAQLEENLEVLDLRLEPDHLERLERVTAIDPGVPHGFLASSDGKEFFLGI